MSEFIKSDNHHPDESQPPDLHIAMPPHGNTYSSMMKKWLILANGPLYPARITPINDKLAEHINIIDYHKDSVSDVNQQKHLEELGYNSDFIAGYMHHKEMSKPDHQKESLHQVMGEKSLSSLSAYTHLGSIGEYIEPPLANWEDELLGAVKHTKSYPSISDMMFNTIEEPYASYESPVRRRDPRQEQLEAEATYDIVVKPLEFEVELTPDELIERMEVDHAVKVPPRFKDQVKDRSRKNRISYKKPVRNNYGNVVMEKRVSMTEHQMLIGLNKFLDTAIEYGKLLSADYDTSKKAQRIRDNLTFIGRKEYKEAVRGIATYWKALLDRNPDQQILVLAGEIAKRYESGGGRVKSDEYLLDNILGQFSDEDAEKYRGRLITDISDITATDAKDLKIVLLDDWTISGSQLSTVAESLMDQLPRFKKSIEVQLVTANRDRVTRGLEVRDPAARETEIKIPVRTYYQAHESPKSTYGAHISGFHSSVDYDFENSINSIIYEIGYGQKRPQSLRDLPPLTNIVRPYRTKRYKLTQKDRFRRR